MEIGLIPSLARPGGNLTGLNQDSADLMGKRLQSGVSLLMAHCADHGS